MNRRHFLGTSLLAGLAGQALAKTKDEDSFDFAYLTDIHVQPELGAPEGFRQCLRAVNALATPADFVLTGGDLIFDALDVGMDRIREQWKVFDECSKELALPVHHAIGNHDVVGWSSKSQVKPTDQDYGKKLFAERFGLARTYRSFDHKGWHFIILDSIGQNKETLEYEGWIDDAQLAWLKQDLATTGRTKPIVMVTHIPFYTIWHQVLKGPDHHLDGKAIVRNLHTFRKLFDDYNLQLVLSGHGHVVERIEIGKVTYLQGGAVSGMWWPRLRQARGLRHRHLPSRRDVVVEVS